MPQHATQMEALLQSLLLSFVQWGAILKGSWLLKKTLHIVRPPRIGRIGKAIEQDWLLFLISMKSQRPTC